MPLSLCLLTSYALVQGPSPARPTEALQLDQILARNYEARGGLEKIKALRSFRMVMTFGDQKTGFPMTIEARRPGHFRAELVINGVKVIQGFDGSAGWVVNQFSKNPDPQAMGPEELAKLKLQADMDGPLVDWQAKGHRIEFLGLEKITEGSGEEAIKLKLTLATGQEIITYLDAKSYLEVKQVTTRKVDGVLVDNETTTGDYRKVQGLVFPFHQEMSAKGSKTVQTMTLSTIDIDPVLSDDRFKQPPKPVDPPKPAEAPKSADTPTAAAASK